MFSLTAALRRAAQLNPAGDALRHEGRSQPWRTFPDRVARLAGGLAALGVGPGVGWPSSRSIPITTTSFTLPWPGWAARRTVSRCSLSMPKA